MKLLYSKKRLHLNKIVGIQEEFKEIALKVSRKIWVLPIS